MASINIISNLGEVTDKIREKLNVLKNPDYLLRPVCFDLIDLMTRRIHNEGKASDEGSIGTYEKSYLALRQRKYARSSDPKIIVSLTRQLENDWAVIPTQKGYGIGFNNSFNLAKARFVEENKKREIFSLSLNEQQYTRDRVQELVQEALRA